jgi:hypothetical protein
MDDALLRVDHRDPWYADIVNFMASGYVPPGGDKRKLIYECQGVRPGQIRKG